MTYNIVDIFAGAGGLGEGFRQAGFILKLSAEMDSYCIKTLITRELYHYDKSIYLNYIKSGYMLDEFFAKTDNPELYTLLSKNVLEIKLGENNYKEISKRAGTVDILVGGPPCQAYSIIGRSRDLNRKKSDPRHYLFRVYLKILDEIKPKFFIYENVPGLLTAKSEDGLISKMFVDDLNKLDTPYLFVPKRISSRQLSFLEQNTLRDYLTNMEDYGIPQKRKRIILIGVKKTIYNRNKKIVDELWTNIEDNISEKVNVRQAIWDLPILDIKALNFGKDRSRQNYRKVNKSIYALIMDSGFGVYNHKSRTHMPSDLKRYKYYIKNTRQGKQRPSIKTLGVERPELLPDHKNKSSFIDRFKVQLYQEPASTITAHISKDGHYYIHPDIKQCRSLTVREAARIQSFPDNFFFEGPRTEQFKQVGNAVPPLFANIVARELKLVLDKLKN